LGDHLTEQLRDGFQNEVWESQKGADVMNVLYINFIKI